MIEPGPRTTTSLWRARSLRPIRVAVVVAAFTATLLLGIRLGIVTGAANVAAGRPPIRPLVELAFLAIYASPALIGAVGLLRRSQGAVAAAGLICLPLAFTSFGLVTLPLLIPMALFFIGAARLPAPRWAWLETPVLTAAAIAAWFVLLIPRETISYTLPGGGFGSSEEPTLAGAAAALALIAAAGIVAWLWPRSPAPEPTLAPW